MIYKKIRDIFSMIFALALVGAPLSVNLPRVAAVGNHLDTTYFGAGKIIIDMSPNDVAANDVVI